MNWRDYLPLAARLAGGFTEAEWRSAVSRTYYTVFHVARLLLADLKFTIPQADRAHQYLVFRLAIGQPLPILPLALDQGQCLPLDLESTYDEACRERRLT